MRAEYRQPKNPWLTRVETHNDVPINVVVKRSDYQLDSCILHLLLYDGILGPECVEGLKMFVAGKYGLLVSRIEPFIEHFVIIGWMKYKD